MSFNICGTKSTQSILDNFTKDLQKVADRETEVVELERAKITDAKAKIDSALAEGGLAINAIRNITALFTDPKD